MANVRESIEKNPLGVTFTRKVYAKSYDALMSKVPKDLVSTFEHEFHAIFTFAFLMPLQLFYLWYILSGNTPENGFGFISLHFHLIVILFGGAAFRCLVGYLVHGKVMEEGECYDYVINAGSAGSQKTGSKSSDKKDFKSSPEMK